MDQRKRDARTLRNIVLVALVASALIAIIAWVGVSRSVASSLNNLQVRLGPDAPSPSTTVRSPLPVGTVFDGEGTGVSAFSVKFDRDGLVRTAFLFKCSQDGPQHFGGYRSLALDANNVRSAEGVLYQLVRAGEEREQVSPFCAWRFTMAYVPSLPVMPELPAEWQTSTFHDILFDGPLLHEAPAHQPLTWDVASGSWDLLYLYSCPVTTPPGMANVLIDNASPGAPYLKVDGLAGAGVLHSTFHGHSDLTLLAGTGCSVRAQARN